MSRPTGHGGGGHKAGRKGKATRTTPDRAYYGGIAIIIGFGLMLWYLVSPDTLPHGAVGAAIAVAFLVNRSAYQAYRGRTLGALEQALARLPLRCVGFGRKGGRPIETAHGRREVLTILLVSIAFSVLVILGLTLWLIPIPWA